MMFSPSGNTVNVAVTGTAQNLALTAGSHNVRLANIGPQTLFLRFDGVTATVSNGMPMAPNTVEMFAKGSASTISVIAATTGSTLYATSGDGE